jgi:hypothetical protein
MAFGSYTFEDMVTLVTKTRPSLYCRQENIGGWQQPPPPSSFRVLASELKATSMHVLNVDATDRHDEEC